MRCRIEAECRHADRQGLAPTPLRNTAHDATVGGRLVCYRNAHLSPHHDLRALRMAIEKPATVRRPPHGSAPWLLKELIMVLLCELLHKCVLLDLRCVIHRRWRLVIVNCRVCFFRVPEQTLAQVSLLPWMLSSCEMTTRGSRERTPRFLVASDISNLREKRARLATIDGVHDDAAQACLLTTTRRA